MSLSDLSQDIFDAIFLEIFPGSANGKIKDVLNVYKVLPMPSRTKLQTHILLAALPLNVALLVKNWLCEIEGLQATQKCSRERPTFLGRCLSCCRLQSASNQCIQRFCMATGSATSRHLVVVLLCAYA